MCYEDVKKFLKLWNKIRFLRKASRIDIFIER